MEINSLKFIDEGDGFLQKYSHESLELLKRRIEQVQLNSHKVQDEIIRRLQQDKKMLQREIRMVNDDRLCCVCQDAEKDVLFLPCKHICVCGGCRSKLVPGRCPVCKQDIRSYLHKIHY